MHESLAVMGDIVIYVSFLEYARGTLITGMKTEGFQKTGGFKRSSEATLLVSLSDFADKIYEKQIA